MSRPRLTYNELVFFVLALPMAVVLTALLAVIIVAVCLPLRIAEDIAEWFAWMWCKEGRHERDS